MKKRILMFLAILSIAVTTANAEGVEPSRKVNVSRAANVIDAFIEAQVKGDASLFQQILADDMVMKVNRPTSINSHTKEDLLTYYKKNPSTLMNCRSNYEILSRSEASIMARIDFKFPTFVQQNFVSLEKDSTGSWKITQLNRFNKAV